MASLLPSFLPISHTLCRLRHLALIVGLACWLAACQKSEAPQPTTAGAPPPSMAGAQPAPPPAPLPAPPPAQPPRADPEPAASALPAPPTQTQTQTQSPSQSPPKARMDPPPVVHQQQQQQASARPPHYEYQQQNQAGVEAPWPPIARPPAAANGSSTRPPPKYSAKPAPVPRPAPEAAPARPPAAAADPAPETAGNPPPTTASQPPPAIAAFDWPPPKASAQEAIPDKWLRTGPAPTLADVADKFEKAMKLAGYQQRSYYSVPRGFALAAQFEHIRADGTPLPGEDRWRVGTPRLGNLSLLAFIQALARAPAGIYRAIVFVVTDAPWTQSAATPSEAQIMAWAGSGASALPAAIGNLPYGANYRAHALIYEFRKGASGPAETVLPSAVSGEIHLDKGGLWDPLSIL